MTRENQTMNPETTEEEPKIGVTAIVCSVIASLPDRQFNPPSDGWHWAFMRLRDKYHADLPSLEDLEFSLKPAVWPVSEQLENIFQMINIANVGNINRLDEKQKLRLKKRFEAGLINHQSVIQKMGEELSELLDLTSDEKFPSQILGRLS